MAESIVHCSFEAAGQMALADRMLVFSRLPNASEVYRFTLSDTVGTRVYVGRASA